MSKRVLVVDDDHDMVSTLSDILELHGWTVARAYDGSEAIDFITANAVDVVLMDVRMPKVDGISALAEIKRLRPSARVILMTAFAAQDLLTQAERQGALRILRKPLDLRELLEIMEDAHKQSRAVLIVDDDPAFLRTLSATLREHGIPTAEAETLPDALKQLENLGPYAVLLDLKLDSLDPQNSLVAIRELSPAVLLILYSGHPHDLSRTVHEAPPGMVDAAFTKPIPLDRLLDLLQ